MQQFRPGGFSILPPVIKNLLIINGLFFLSEAALQKAFGINIVELLGLHYIGASAFNPAQIITYLFLHGSFSHLFFNMFALWMFGSQLENIWGAKKFLIFYLIAGIGAGFTNQLVNYYQLADFQHQIAAVIQTKSLYEIQANIAAIKNSWSNNYAVMNAYSMITDHSSIQQGINFLSEFRNIYENRFVTIGASGSVFGLLMAFGMMFPNNIIYLYFALPMKVKWFVLGYGLIELFSGFYESNSNIAHFAHIGGMVFAFFVIMYWKRKGKLYSSN